MSNTLLPSIDRQSWHPLAAGYPPQWATAWGEDQYGVFAIAKSFDISFCVRWIPPGQFQIGSPETEYGRDEDESPQTQVTIERGYWFMDAPVTQALWEAVMRDNPSRFRSRDRPVENVSWHDIVEFLGKLNEELVGGSLRLPSESEWEYASRAGSEESTYAGALEILGENNAPMLDEIAWYSGNGGVGFVLEDGYDSSNWPEKQYEHEETGTHPVRQKRPNRWGCYDLLGNVFEWCEDVWSESHEGIDRNGRARLGVSSSYKHEARVARGGSWHYQARYVRAAFRYRRLPDRRYDFLGFRCVLGQTSLADLGGRQLSEKMSRTNQQKKLVTEAGDEYIRILSLGQGLRPFHAEGDFAGEKAKLICNLAALGTPIAAEDLAQEFERQAKEGRDSMIQLQRMLMESLSQEISECLSTEELETFNLCDIRLVDTGEPNAYSFNQTSDGRLLPGFVILVSLRLYFCIKLLITAQIYEDLQGDYKKYRKSGANIFAGAFDLFVKQSTENLNIRAVLTGDPEVDGAIEAHVALGSTLLLKFIVLHEIGNAHLGYTESFGQGRSSALGRLDKTDNTSRQSASGAIDEAVFAADEFAWRALASSDAENRLKNLGNMYVITLFFGFLGTVESRHGRLNVEIFPAPKRRINNLFKLFAPDGLTEQDRLLFDKQDSLLKSWLQAVPKTEK